MTDTINDPRWALHQDPREPAFYQHPYPQYAALHARSVDDAPMVYWHEYKLWCLYGFESVNTILKDRRFGRQILHCYDRQTLGLAESPAHMQDFQQVEAWSLLTLEPPQHTTLRKLVTRAFVTRSVEKMKPRIISYAHELIDNFAHVKDKSGRIDLLKHYATPLPARIIAEMIGVPQQHIADLLRWSNTMVRVYTMTQSFEEEVAANQAAREFSTLIQALINERRLTKQDDLLSHLTTTTLDGDESSQGLSDEQIISTVILLLNAGHEATVHQIGNAVKALLECEWTPAELLSDDQQCQKTVQEIMRFDTPLHLFTRYALEPVVLTNGVELKAGEQIGLLLGAANHDPERFDKAQQFNPFRTDAGHVSLGAGIHYCLGAVLAQLELNVALQVLFERIPELQLAESPDYRDSFHFRGLSSLSINVDGS